MKNTKIICTMGPSCIDIDIFKEMIDAGMNVARINLSHATKDQINDIMSIANGYPDIGVMFDTKGPELRLINIDMEVKMNDEIVISKDNFNHSEVIDSFKIGNILEIDDGTIKLEVISKMANGILVKCLNSGVIKNNKGVFVPGVMLNLPFLSKSDYEDILLAIKCEASFLALSFVTCREDILEVKKILEEHNSQMKIIAKIENKKAIDNLDDIISNSDGVMVARGDLGIEVSMSLLPVYQKQIIKSARRWGKFVIVATQMLDSMKSNLIPTRAEVSDVANAVMDAVDAVMLSGETSVGKYPVETVSFMSNVLSDIEKFRENDECDYKSVDVTKMIAKCALEISKTVPIKAIITNTLSGDSARILSNFKSLCPILAICENERVARSLSINYGVVSVVDQNKNTLEDMVYKAKRFFDLDSGDKVIVLDYNTKRGVDDILSIHSI